MVPMTNPVPSPARPSPIVDAIAIGRNEGARLDACLASLAGRVRRVVYVDSGSTDGSPARAAAAGAQVVALDMGQPFTAARARNAGLAALAADPPDLVLTIDGDCTLQPGFLPAAIVAFAAHPRAVAVCGRRRERHPEASVWNRLCDREWNTPPGPARACGGDALFRFAPLMQAGGYRATLIAGEEPELCLRLIRAGGEVWRIDHEMTLHDAAILRLGQWWRRTRRAGHAFAEGAHLHGSGPERHWVAESRRALLWGVALPLAVAGAALVQPGAGLALAALYPAQMARLSWRWRAEGRAGAEAAVFTVLGRLAEGQGALAFHLNRLRGGTPRLIEYK